MRTKLDVFVLAGCLILAPRAPGATKDDPWENLRHVTWRGTYTFVDRESNCIRGRITDQSVTLRLPKAATITMHRSNVLRVIDGPHVFDVVYSGKSSWSDVEAIRPNPKEGVKVVAKDGKHYSGKFAGASDTQITLTRHGRSVKIAKGDVFRVFYVRQKPLSDSAIYAAREMVVLDPELWPYLLNIGVKIPVLLYDSSMPEDPTHVQCQEEPGFSPQH